MPNAWKGYATVNDDVRHTYERVFYGRQLTGDLTESEVPGIGSTPPEQKEPGEQPGATTPGATPGGIHGAPAGVATPGEQTSLYNPDAPHAEREAAAKAWEHAANAPGIRAEIEEATDRRYQWAEAAPIQSRGGIHGAPADEKATDAASLYGPATADKSAQAGNVWGSNAGPGAEPADHNAEPSSTQQPSAGNDMTPD